MSLDDSPVTSLVRPEERGVERGIEENVGHLLDHQQLVVTPSFGAQEHGAFGIEDAHGSVGSRKQEPGGLGCLERVAVAPANLARAQTDKVRGIG